MSVTTPANVPDWIPGAIVASFYDQVGDPALALTKQAVQYPDLSGKPGDTIRVPTALATSPADDLAVTVPAVDDNLVSGAYTMTVSEGVKSIAWYDRTQVQSGQDVNALAGSRLGNAMLSRVELNLGAKLVAGRNTAKDRSIASGTKFTVADIRAMKRAIPARLRKNGLVLVGETDILDDLLDDATVNNAATFGSDEALRNGEFTRPLAGVTIIPVDDGTFPDVTIAAATGTPVVMFAKGMLAYGFQKSPTVETERDARARLTRHVGTMLHAEGTLEAVGIVAVGMTGR